MEKAADAGLINIHLLNGMMQVYTSAGSLDSAVALYEEYEKHNEVSPVLHALAGVLFRN